MSYLNAVLIAESRKLGRAVRSASLRHRHLSPRPLGMLLWQLGAEPFTAAAVNWGFGQKDRSMVVPGEPRDRELAFRALTTVARAFNPWFEGGHGGDGPQIVVPNRGNLTLLGRLGRRLAFLPTTGDRPADPELVRFGRHLKWLFEYARYPGQQLVVVLSELLADHWISELSPLEAQSLAAMDAMIEPPRGKTGHDAAAEAELREIGPLPSGEADDRVDPLVTKFNKTRARRTDEATVAPLRKPIEAHYAKLSEDGWALLWRCLERERRVAEAPHVKRRWAYDVEQLGRHLEWVVSGSGSYRARQTHEQAARTLADWEKAYELLLAEEAVDDPLRMLPYLLTNDALAGTVVRVDLENREETEKSVVRRPVVELEVDELCTIPAGKAFYWTEEPGGREWIVEAVRPSAKGARSIVRLVHQTGRLDALRPTKGKRATFSIHTTKGGWFPRPRQEVPWTHQRPIAHSEPLDRPGEEGSWE